VDLNSPSELGTVEAVEPLTHNAGNAATGGIWRVRGTTGTAIRKVYRPPADPPAGRPGWQTSDVPTHWNYWRREYLAYTTGFAATVYAGTGIEPPALLGASDKPETEIWLADVTGTSGIMWSVDRLGGFAYRLGLGQARYAGRTSPERWLSTNWLAQYVADRQIAEPVPWDHPAAGDWSDRVRTAIRPLWERRFALAAQAEQAPRTLCHLDVWPMNLIGDGDRSVLLDWAFTGEGALGEDIANLIVDSVADGFIDTALLPEIEAATTDGYLRGLRDGGWRGSDDDVRRAIALTGAAKYAWLAPAMLTVAARGVARGGSPSYDPESTAAQVRIRRGRLLELLVDWVERLAR
jgi:hypothetical protein